MSVTIPLTITVTFQMTAEEAEALAYVTSDEHPGRLSLEAKLRTFAYRHPAIVARIKAQEEAAARRHEAVISRTASTRYLYASCSCGWSSRNFVDIDKAEAALERHRAGKVDQ